ncbi:hypothetical protein NBRC116188_20460 [Oceaniserpentilla sp. 4NH20-0058]|uniref:hypothetical protein n=1 Tax=Oceaniserpentilla sp. 4NH20-0058 TaxID=3127660 RepID=UPI0031083E31
MPTLIFQLTLKQWDKSQRHDAFQTAIANATNVYPIQSKPEFRLFELPCVFDQHTLDFTTEPLEPTSAEHIIGNQAGRPIKQSLLEDGSAKLDRFIISNQQNSIQLAYEDEEGNISKIGGFKNGWIQAQYQWRYRVEKNNEIFWLYEEVTLNAALVDEIKQDVFLAQPPASTFNTAKI